MPTTSVEICLVERRRSFDAKFFWIRKSSKSANFQTSLPSIISTAQGKPVRRMRHSSQAGLRLHKYVGDSRSRFVSRSKCARRDSRRLHRRSNLLRDEFREGFDVQINAHPIKRPQVVVTILKRDDGPRIQADHAVRLKANDAVNMKAYNLARSTPARKVSSASNFQCGS
jgi:hypothetical protein